MSGAESDFYEFGPYRLDIGGRVLTRDEQVVPLAPKTFELLLLMLRNPGRALPKQEVMSALWPDAFVEEANLSFQIATLRKALGDSGAGWIETVPKHGYRFSADVQRVASASTAQRSPNVGPYAATVSRSARKYPRLAAVGAVVVLVVAAYLTLTSRSATTNGTVRASATPLTSYPGFENGPSLSPDGSQVAFAWDGPTRDNFDIYIKLVGPGEPYRLTSNPARDDNPVWSPDGRLIAFQRLTSANTADVYVIPALGGAERKVGSISVRGYGVWSANRFGARSTSNLGWTPDGKWIAYGGGPSDDAPRGIWLIGMDHRETRPLTQTGEHDFGDAGPTFSPDGRYLAFLRQRTKSGSAVHILPLTSKFTPAGPSVQITRDTSVARGLAWTPDSHGLVFSLGGHLGLSRLYKVAVPLTRIAQTVEPELLPFGEQSTSVSISKAGRLVYSAQFSDASIWKIAQNAEPPTPTQVVPSTFDEQTPAYSPDGKRLAFASTRSGTEEIWVSAADGSDPVQLTSMGGQQCSNPQWSPDSRTILFSSRREGSADLYLLDPETGQSRRITEDPDEEVEPRWSRDGRTIYFGSNRTGRYEVWKMRAAGGPPIRITKEGGLTASESPDRRFLYYAKGDTSPTAIWRVPVDGGEEQPVVEGLSYSLNFVVSDRGLYFLAVGDAPQKTSIDFFEFSTGRRTTILRVDKEYWWGMALAPDQQSLLYSIVDSAGSNLMLVDNFR